MLNEIQRELVRINAQEIVVSEDVEFEPSAGPLSKICLDDAVWHMLPADFLALLKELPNGAGAAAVHRAIEICDTQQVWHGPAPPDSRDT